MNNTKGLYNNNRLKRYNAKTIEQEILVLLEHIQKLIESKSDYEVELISQNNQEIMNMLGVYKEICANNKYDWCASYIGYTREMLKLFQDIYDIRVKSISNSANTTN